jgi:hypothetical protein
LAFGFHFDHVDAKHRADAAGEPIDGVTVLDVDGGRYPAAVCIRPGAHDREAKARDAGLIEKPPKCGMHVAGVELQRKHDRLLSFFRTFVLAGSRIVVPNIWVFGVYAGHKFWLI